MQKKQIKKSEFVGLCMDLAEKQTRKEHKLREESHLNSQRWVFRNGAYAMAYAILEQQYEIVEGLS